MPYKNFVLESGQEIKIYKRPNSKYLKLNVDHYGNVRMSIPKYSSYRYALKFANTKQDWIKKYRIIKPLIQNGQQIGKYHHITFIPKSGLKTIRKKITSNDIVVTYPLNLQESDDAVQLSAKKASTAALKMQASQLLKQRLDQICAESKLDYTNLRIKNMKSRWGSCDIKKNITLNCQLMLLPWELIDYVIMHELIHTLVLRHNDLFWKHLLEHMPTARERRKQLKYFRPEVFTI